MPHTKSKIMPRRPPILLTTILTTILSFLLPPLLRPCFTDAVLHGSYISADSFDAHPFRGAVQSGGGTGIVLFQDSDEAVILTVAHGYDLTTKDAQEVMDYKLNSDGGLRLANGSVHGYATSTGGDQIIGANLGLFRHFTFWDRETCPIMNGNGGVDPKHTGTNPDDPYGCDGLGPDIDVALQRVRLTDEYIQMSPPFFPEIKLSLDAPPTPGQSLTLVGFGRKNPCRWDDMTDDEVRWEEDTGDALKIAQNRVRAVFTGEVFTDGQSTTDDARKFGCDGVVATAECGKLNGTLVLEEQDNVQGGRWGTGCAGDSGGAWLTSNGNGGWSAIGVNRAAGKTKDSNGNWDQSEDPTYQDGLCANGEQDACQPTGSSIATLYPVRAQIKEALTAWNPAWAEKASYTCEPPSLENPCCGVGCQVCYDGDGSFDCYPDSYQCANVEALGSGMGFICGDSLSTTSVPVQKCKGVEGDGTDPPCRALTAGKGWRQEQVCRAADIDGVCPGLTTCCDTNRCSTKPSLPTCETTPNDDNIDDNNNDDDDGDGTCESLTNAGEAQCTNALGNTCKWTTPKYGVCQAKPNGHDCTKYSTKKQCKKKGKPKNFCKWNASSTKCVHKCDTIMNNKKKCVKAKKNKKKLCNHDDTALLPGTGCTPK